MDRKPRIHAFNQNKLPAIQTSWIVIKASCLTFATKSNRKYLVCPCNVIAAVGTKNFWTGLSFWNRSNNWQSRHLECKMRLASCARQKKFVTACSFCAIAAVPPSAVCMHSSPCISCSEIPFPCFSSACQANRIKKLMHNSHNLQEDGSLLRLVGLGV